MTPLLGSPVRWWSLSASAPRWRVRGDDHSLGAGVMVTTPRGAVVAQLGWGWDAEQPLRPWPSLSLRPSPRGHRGGCLTWCGLLVNVRWRRRPT